MRRILLLLLAGGCMLYSCSPNDNNTESESFAPDALINVKAEPGIGEITFSWTNPVYYSYAELTYVNSDGLDVKVVVRDKSVDATAGGGVTTYTLTGFTDTNTYTFTLTPYGPTFEAGPSTVIQCAPDTDIPGALIDVAVERQGGQLVFKWANPARYNYAMLEYTDTNDDEIKLKVTKDFVDPVLGEGHTQYILGGFFDVSSSVFKITPYGFTDKPGPSYSVIVDPIAASPETPVLGWFLNKDGSITVAKQPAGDKESYAVIAYVGSVEHYFSHFIALALNDCTADGSDGQASMAYANGMTAIGLYASKHPVTINGTTYNTNTSGSDPYDVVAIGKTTSSATRTGDAETGWRMPSVTDWRYIFEGLTASNEEGARASATDPIGVQNMTYNNIPNNEGTILKNAINAACGNEGLSAFYWVNSDHSGKPVNSWNYRFDMNIWGLLGKTNTAPHVRAVFAY